MIKRMTFLIRIFPGKTDEARVRIKELFPAAAEKAVLAGASNLSLWRAEDMIFGYYETAKEADNATGQILRDFIEENLSDVSVLIASPGNMRLMYAAIGSPREDKSMLKHRVFVTRLKPGCAEEYKARHDALATMQRQGVGDKPENNFTIWNSGDYICGYSEIDPDYVPDNSEMAQKARVAWETRMLGIMDWLTDDVDDITGEEHDKIECMYRGT